jgi:hypothetical protein
LHSVHWVGANVPAIVPWALSFLNGMTILGFLFARINRRLPGRNGAVKGVVFGLIGWVFMGLVFFPLIGLGLFAMSVGSGFGPAVLSLVMLQTYSIVLGTVYVALDTHAEEAPMSALGQKRTLRVQGRMSALCQKQTFCAAAETALFDYLVGAGQHRRRNGNAERISGFKIDDQFKFGRQLYSQLTRVLIP